MLKAQLQRHKPIQLIKIDIAQQLRGQVANSHAATKRLVKQAFARRQAFPGAARTVEHRVFEGIIKDNDFP